MEGQRSRWMLVVGLCLAGCANQQGGAPTGSTPAGPRDVRVLCSFFPIYLFARNVVGDQSNITVELMVPAEMGCPHDYDLKPSDIKKIANANLVLLNGGHLEEFTADDIRKHNPNVQVIDTSVSIAASEDEHDHHGHDHTHHRSEKAASVKGKEAKPGDHDHKHADHKHEKHADDEDHKHEKHADPKAGKHADHDHKHEKHADHKHEKHAEHKHDKHADHGHGHDHGHHHEGGVNPHFFSNPRHAANQVRSIGEALAQADPAGAATYRKNADEYADKLIALGAEFAAAAKSFQNKSIVTVHEVFDYLAEECGLEIVTTIHSAPGHEPSAGDMRKLIDTIKARKAAAIFTEPQFEGKAPATVAKDAGVPHFELDPVASGPADAPKDYYEARMRQNLETLNRALGTPKP